MHKGNKKLVKFVNNFLKEESKSGRLDELKNTNKLTEEHAEKS